MSRWNILVSNHTVYKQEQAWFNRDIIFTGVAEPWIQQHGWTTNLTLTYTQPLKWFQEAQYQLFMQLGHWQPLFTPSILYEMWQSAPLMPGSCQVCGPFFYLNSWKITCNQVVNLVTYNIFTPSSITVLVHNHLHYAHTGDNKLCSLGYAASAGLGTL